MRGVPSDMYYRGMKRLQMQGHVRTVLSAMDGIEVVKGPPSPIYGMGTHRRLPELHAEVEPRFDRLVHAESQGFVQTTQGSYNRTETQGGVGGPFNPFGKEGGYYVFGLLRRLGYLREEGRHAAGVPAGARRASRTRSARSASSSAVRRSSRSRPART